MRPAVRAVSFQHETGRWARSAEQPLGPFVPLLLLEAQRRGRPREQAADADRFAGRFAITVSAVLNTSQRSFDLVQQLQFAVTDALLQHLLFFLRRAVSLVGSGDRFAQMGAGFLAVLAQFRLQREQPLAEELELRIVHVVVGRHTEQFGLRQGAFSG
ncbi:hypothetical protein ebA3051 [Aromatoleum aromaticum EbN1]|uniref:Uncharacterized protein n=1 Tax=Aromatoleum aromaticum (strain DSM 19018 / LMG 30748 / EbN1) TaxID=76114 RepID=Q5P4B7_AROAE|nr:hypothetical protein ebA3051 [Aromatoleum aromaticum EbN1]